MIMQLGKGELDQIDLLNIWFVGFGSPDRLIKSLVLVCSPDGLFQVSGLLVLVAQIDL